MSALETKAEGSQEESASTDSFQSCTSESSYTSSCKVHVKPGCYTIAENPQTRTRSLSDIEINSAKFNCINGVNFKSKAYVGNKKRRTADEELKAFHAEKSQVRRSLKDVTKRIIVLNKPGKKALVEANITPWYILSCNSKTRTLWDILLLFLVAFIAIVSPLRLGFDIDSGQESFWQELDYSIDALFIFDVALNFFTTFLDVNGMEIYDHKTIVRHYVQTWFSIDALSSIPFSAMLDTTSEGNNGVHAAKTTKMAKVGQAGKIVKIARALKMLKLIRIVKASIFLRRFADFFICSRIQRKIFKLCLITMLIAHFNACLFGFAAQISDQSIDETWYVSANLIDSTPAEQYVAALYFCVGTITTVGYGDIYPASTEERVVVIYLMVVGSGYYSYVIATISKCLDLLEISKVQYYRKADELSRYMKYQKFPRGLYEKVQTSMRLNYKSINMRNKDHLLTYLSPALKQEVEMFVCNTRIGRFIQHVHIFKALEAKHVFKLVHLFRSCSVHPGDYIVKNGQVGASMYVILDGKVAVDFEAVESEELTDPGTQMYKEGEYFGEENMLGLREEYPLSIFALEFSGLIALNQKEFMEVIGNDDDLLEIVISGLRVTV